MALSLRRALPLAVIAAALIPASAQATVTRTAVTTPTGPTFRLLQPEVKAVERLLIMGTSDGAPGDLVDLTCSRGDALPRLKDNVPVGKDGGFSALVELDVVKPAACILRALPSKYIGKELAAYTGPLLSVTYFAPRAGVTAVRGSEGVVPLDFGVETGHRRGHATLGSAGGGGLRAQYGVGPALDRYATQTWRGGAGLASLVVDGRVAYVGAGIPRFDYGSQRPEAPLGFDGVQSQATVDPVTGDVVVTETARALRCDRTDAGNPDAKQCATVLDTGVRLQRTVTFSGEHAVADVRDRWVSTDEGPHRIRLEYAEQAAPALWRFPGFAGFRKPVAGERVVPHGPGTVLVHDGSTAQAVGALTYDPAPEAFVFSDSDRATEILTLDTPAAVRRTFTLGENVIQPDVEPPVITVERRGPSERVTVREQGRQEPRPQPVNRCVVPRVRVGAKLSAAKSALKKAGCTPGKVSRARSAKVKKGRVVRLSRSAGKQLPAGTAVGIKVSRGRR